MISEQSNEDMEYKLSQLECLFTWQVERSDIMNFDFFPKYLLNKIKSGQHKYHATYFNILAFVSHLEGKTERSLDYLQQAESALKDDNQKKDADYLMTFSSFAWVHYHLHNLDDVEKYLNKVKNICRDIPGSSEYSCSLPVIHGEKAWTFIRLGRSFYERAKESFSKGLEAEPDNELCNLGYAIVLYRIEGMKKRAISAEDSKTVTQLRKALSLQPTNPVVMVLLALKLQCLKREEAQELIKEALKLSPDVPQVTRHVGKYFRAEGSIKESLSILEKAVELTPNSTFLHHQIGLCHKQLLIEMLSERRPGRRFPATQISAKAAECIRHFSKAIELKPSNIYAQVNLAEAYGENWRELGEAEKIFTRLINDTSLSDNEKQHCHTRYGVFLLYKRKDEDTAVSQFKIAYKIPIDSYDRKQAGKKLRQIAERHLNDKRKVREAFEILAFVSSEDKQEAQAAMYLQRAQQHSDSDELSETFAKGLRLKP